MEKTKKIAFSDEQRSRINKMISTFGLEVKCGCVEPKEDGRKVCHIGFDSGTATTFNYSAIGARLKNLLNVDDVFVEGKKIA